jgi:DNA-binding transcriptional MocR family regulator
VTLLNLLEHEFGQKVQIGEVTSGTDARLIFNPQYSSELLAEAAEAAGLPLVSTAQKYVHVQPIRNEFTLNFSNLPESRMAPLIQKFRRELDALVE